MENSRRKVKFVRLRVLVWEGFHGEMIATFKAANVRWSKKSGLRWGMCVYMHVREGEAEGEQMDEWM